MSSEPPVERLQVRPRSQWAQQQRERSASLLPVPSVFAEAEMVIRPFLAGMMEPSLPFL